MKFVQNNLVFILFSGVFGLLFLTLFGLSWFLSGSGEETKAKIDEIRTEIENLHYEKLPYVSLEHDLKLATADLDKLASDERALKTVCGRQFLPRKRTLPSIGNPNPRKSSTRLSSVSSPDLPNCAATKASRFPEVGTRVPLLLSANHLRRGRMILALA